MALCICGHGIERHMRGLSQPLWGTTVNVPCTAAKCSCQGYREAKPVCVIGMDLGQSQDYTAAAVDMATPYADDAFPGRLLWKHDFKSLHRWALRTSYTQISADLRRMLGRLPIRYPRMAVDQTGVGRAVVDILRAANLPCVLCPILITSGHQVSMLEGSWSVPKKELVSSLQSALQQRRLSLGTVIDPTSSQNITDLLGNELGSFRVKITAHANETFEAWRERDHDDLVLAVAMAVWLAETYGLPGTVPDVPKPPRPERGTGTPPNAARRRMFGLGRKPA